MTQHETDKLTRPASTCSKRERLHAMLFAGAALGTTLLTLGATVDPKLPPFVGE